MDSEEPQSAALGAHQERLSGSRTRTAIGSACRASQSLQRHKGLGLQTGGRQTDSVLHGIVELQNTSETSGLLTNKHVLLRGKHAQDFEKNEGQKEKH